MCGIIGYVGHQSCRELIFAGLRKLEYRGYDSAGIAVLGQGEVVTAKAVGKLVNLQPLLTNLPPEANIGMGHTRWATHGVPSLANAHPHTQDGLAIVHHGILENYQVLKAALQAEGAVFVSETDTEVIVHLLQRELAAGGDVKQALLRVIAKLEGAFALGVLSRRDPEAIYAVKQGSPLVLGCGEGENFFASDPLALTDYSDRFIFLEDGELARLTPTDRQVWNFKGQPVKKEVTRLDWTSTAVEKGGYRHYMLKEIHEQPAVVAATLQRLVDFAGRSFQLEALGVSGIDLARVTRIHLIGCGTAYYAALLGKYILEPATGIPCEVELASEFRYRDPLLDAQTLVIAVTQSGETADTLACVKHAKKVGCQILAVCNVDYASIPREAHGTINMRAGAEIGVASTKAFTSMVLNLHLFALAYRGWQGRLAASECEEQLNALRRLPGQMTIALGKEAAIAAIARRYEEEAHCLYLGRGFSYGIAMEGALKLKEISYIHAEGYAGGELKHGPIALIDKTMPVVAIVPQDRHYEKMLSNIEEVRARSGRVLGIGAEGDERLQSLCEQIIPCPQSSVPALQAILSTIPLQLFAYYVAFHRGTDVDQPRNLAKSVTVE